MDNVTKQLYRNPDRDVDLDPNEQVRGDNDKGKLPKTTIMSCICVAPWPCRTLYILKFIISSILFFYVYIFYKIFDL